MADLKIADVKIRELQSRDWPGTVHHMVEVVGDAGVSGFSAPIYPEIIPLVLGQVRQAVVGRDALAIGAAWDAMKLCDRHSRAGAFMMAMSAVDIALWDLKGKALGCSVASLLRGPFRTEIPVYASLLGFPTEAPEARSTARRFFDQGFHRQKWFFDFGPAEGAEGLKKNVALAFALREELGDGAMLMFDAKWAWDVPYAIAMAKAIAPMNPAWLEEPLRSENLEGYRAIRAQASIPLAAGEHLYSRWECKPYLDAGCLSWLQADPEWCGGITELARICSLAEVHGVPVAPHGHHLWAALHVVAAHPARVCPMVEYLFHYMPEKLHFHIPQLEPQAGLISLPSGPGLGFEINWSRAV